MWSSEKYEELLARSEKETKERFARSLEYMHQQREKEALEALQRAINDYQRVFGDWR